jgi:hypothetical protein
MPNRGCEQAYAEPQADASRLAQESPLKYQKEKQ